ncbi:hypothetical protein EVA_07884 [gut metagenome]|uniref:Uncharacterized protein n=1 Tax=gut metagenome TaxID=749906 RepID=J9G9P5_9ZZZZ
MSGGSLRLHLMLYRHVMQLFLHLYGRMRFPALPGRILFR